MNFDTFDKKMRVFETASDTCVLPEMYLVARLDGRSFTKLTKKACAFEAPYDSRFRDLMVGAAESLMRCGFKVRFAYIQSDEISLLFDKADQLFSRKLRKFNSILAAQASAQFSVSLGQVATFDCRVSQLPNLDLVQDYFRWRAQDALRNALNSHCYWAMRKSGATARQATRRMVGMTIRQKKAVLRNEFSTDFASLPTWHKRGVGLYWESYLKSATNRATGEQVEVSRRRLKVDLELPEKQLYSEFVVRLSETHSVRST